jgi:L-asparaginase / beta-aspartyl-peptidase
MARRVMTDLPHVLLAGEGAAEFAAASGFKRRSLLTPDAKRIWCERLEGKEPEDATQGDHRYYETVRNWVRERAGAGEVQDTVNFIAKDAAGNIATAVSTSGWEWKYPGRAADSAVVGAGFYCDNRAGAAACTGRGEMAMRSVVAYSVVSRLSRGIPLDDTMAEVMHGLCSLQDPYSSTLSIIAIDASGCPAAVTNGKSTYLYMTEDMSDYVEASRFKIGIPGGS